MNRSVHIICLLFFSIIFTEEKYSKIQFSSKELEYLNRTNEDVVYIDQTTRQILNTCKKELFENSGSSLSQFWQACQNNWKIIPLSIAQEAINEFKIVIEKNKKEFHAEDYEKISSTIKNYEISLKNKDAQFFFASSEAGALNATRAFNNLVVKDTLQVNNLFRVNHNGTLAVRAGNDPIFASGRVVSHLPVRINFTPTQGTPNSFVVIGTTVLDNLLVRTNQTVRGSLNVHDNITIKDAPVILNADNIGSGVGVFKDKSGNILNFKSLVAGSNITLDTSNENQITISATGFGDVNGPVSATDNAIAKYDGTTGKLIQNSGVIIDDSNNLSTTGQITATQFNGPLNGNATSATTATTAVNFTGSLSGDVTGTQSATVVNSIGNGAVTSAQIITTVNTVNAATNLDTPNTLVKRDINGDFISNTINLDANLNLNTSPSTATAGMITQNGHRFVHNTSNIDTTSFFGGIDSGSFSSTGVRNTGIGNEALRSLTAGMDNTGLGYQALTANTGGHTNTAVGSSALRSNSIGLINTAVGASSLENCTTGFSNLAVGYQSLFNFGTGSFNTAVGNNSLQNLASGSQNTAIGYQAGINLTTNESNNVYVANDGVVGDSNTIRIGSADQQRCFITGIRGVATGSADAIPVLIDSNGQLGTINSSIRYKKDIEDMGNKSDKLSNLRPVVFKYKTDKNDKLQYGLIAEEVEKELPELIIYKDGKPETVQYQLLPILLLNELQKMQKKIQQLEAKENKS